MQVEGTRLYRVKAVAEMFDVSVATIYRAVESGALDALKVGSGKGAIRVPGHGITAYWEACSEAAYRAYVLDGEPASDVTDAGLSDEGEVA